MKFICALLLSIFISSQMNAQAKPSYTQYILNNFILNPAISGIENYTDIKMSYRNQWTAIEGAPTTNYFTVHCPLGKNDSRTNINSFDIKGVNPRGKEYWSDYTAPDPHHGIGFTAVNDKSGYINRWTMNVTYAYHLPLSAKTSMSVGFSAGMSSINLDRSKIDFGGMDPNDPAIGYTNNELKKIKPEMGIGCWLYSPSYFAGFSVLNIIPGKNKFVLNNKYGDSFTPNYFLTGGYRFNIGEDFNLIPSFMYQYWKPQLSGLHINTKLQYRDIGWAGASCRISDLISGYSGMIGLKIANAVNLSYSYELAFNNSLVNYTGNTHEILIGFIIGNTYGDSCPRNVW